MMDSFGEVIPTYSLPRTVCQYSVSRTSPKERGLAIERRFTPRSVRRRDQGRELIGRDLAATDIRGDNR
jgi:hypothetical protein